MKKSILFFLLLGMTFFTSCETQETVLTEQNKTTSIYNTAIVDYFNNYKASLSNNKERTKKISALMAAIDYNNIKYFDLKTTEKLLVADLKEFNFTQNATNNKLILFVNDNKIARARLVNFESQDPFNQYDALIVSILNMDKTKLNYTGRVNQFDIIQNKEFSNVFSDGKLIENGATKNKVLNSIAAKGDCIDWYWVTTYSNGSQTEEYLYTTCDPCDALLDKSANCGGGGSSGASSGASPSFPPNPYDKQPYNFTSPDGVYTEYRYNEQTNNWDIVINNLPDVVVRSNPTKYPKLVIIWPFHNQKVVSDGLLYTYDASGTGNWEGVLATNEVIAKTIEDQIDYSKLNPCQKAIMDKLKNTTVCDIAEILTKLGANKSLYNTTIKSEPAPSGLPAQTVRNSAYDYTIYISTDYVGKTKLFIAASMVHEMVHAYFMSLFDDYYNSNPPNLNAYNDFASLFDYYVTLKRPSSINPADVSHQQMATDYVDAIARSLQEYQTGISVPIGSNPDQIYSDLAWGGLSDAPVFDAIYPVGNPNRQRILNRYQAEGRGSTVGQGSPQVQSPISQPCN
jgi:small nuclear ribonucleoprotein (snRNP)-like protein